MKQIEKGVNKMKSGLMLGVNPLVNRQQNDFYATQPDALKLFLDNIDFELSNDVWEPACGMGHLSELLSGRDYKVLSTDLVDRGYGKTGVDFLNRQILG
jgi:hypothetical protein